MGYLLLFGVVIAVGWLLIMMFLRADPRVLAAGLRYGAIGVGVLVLGLLAYSGRLGQAAMIAPLLLPLFIRWRRSRPVDAGGGKVSSVESDSLRMWIDHDTGTMDGEVKSGRHAGRPLSAFSREELRTLLQEIADDNEGARLLAAYLDRRFPGWREDPDDAAGSDRNAGADRTERGGMSREEALGILGLEPGAGDAEIREAHRRLMQKNHPDQGGSTWLAARINQAKDILLGGRNH